MADIEPPSFSLDLDLDDEHDPQIEFGNHSDRNPAPDPCPNFPLPGEDGDEIGPQVMDSDPESDPDQPRLFKRLRRGLGTEKSSANKRDFQPPSANDGDEDIEEFSSQEDVVRVVDPPTQYHSACSTSKVPLRGSGVFSTKSSIQSKTRIKHQASGTPAASGSLEVGYNGLVFPKLTTTPLRRFLLINSDSDDASVSGGKNKRSSKTDSSSKKQQYSISEKQQASGTPAACGSLEVGSNRLVFPKLTSSPLRRFQLIDSDSDDTSVSEDIYKVSNKTDSSTKKQQASSGDQKRKASTGVPDNEDLWKQFLPTNSCSIPTPAFDEMCEEYFQSAKNKTAAQKLGSQKFEQQCSQPDSSTPAHRYFFHDDLTIQRLVTERLRFFSPLGIVNNRENQQPSASVIDYMGQFGNGETSKQTATQKVNAQNSSSSRKNKSRKPYGEGVLHESEGWVNPKSSTPAPTPKNAGKRRVHADGQSAGAGHWYTSPEGRKVYVTKTGQELTGRIAYRQFKKESGGGFKKTKKKSNGSSKAKKRKG